VSPPADAAPGSAADLVHRILNADSSAEAELIERYRRAVAALAQRHTPAAADAEDVFQETFRLVIEKLRQGELREPERLSGFVCSIARNLAIAASRRARRYLPAETIDAQPAVGSGQLETVLQRENVNLVRRVLSELSSERDREVLRRFYLIEDPKAVICQRMGLSSLQFDQVLFRARQRYRALFSRIAEGKREI
jgi:RNA polymerase sigma-70 factor (ECF subfamily)